MKIFQNPSQFDAEGPEHRSDSTFENSFQRKSGKSITDPAARDYILHTILSNYNEHATILISTHLISDIENILDRVLFIQNGELVLNATVDDIRSEQKKSVDALFREVFKC